MTKIYGIYGKTEVIISIPTLNGKSYIRVEFTKGCPNSGAYYRPATYATSNPVEQAIIEASPYFGNMITIWRECGEDGKEIAKAEPAEKVKTETVGKEYPEVTDREGMIAVLKGLGAKAQVLVDDEAIRRFIKNRKLSFPNYEF